MAEAQAIPARRSCCARHWRCILFSSCCWGFFLVLLGVAAFVFWPRLILICVHYAEVRGDLYLSQSPSSPFFTMAPVLTVPMTIDNTNLWGLTAHVTLTAYPSGAEDVPLVRSSSDAYMHPNAVTEFEMVLGNAGGRTAEQAVAVLEAIRAGCGDNPLQWTTRSWMLDLLLEIDRIALTDLSVDVWYRDIAMPCDGGVASAAGFWSESGACQTTMSDRVPDDAGVCCVPFFCAWDDLDCEKTQSPEQGTSPPSPAPPASVRSEETKPLAISDPPPANNPLGWMQGLLGRR
jgi:hypothetical protein